jgi:hypothetical protein
MLSCFMAQQGQLFPEPVCPTDALSIPGFSLRPDYIEADQEHALLREIDKGPWETDWRRRIQQYGLGYSDAGGEPICIREFPKWREPLADRVGTDAHFERYPENCVINEYVHRRESVPTGLSGIWADHRMRQFAIRHCARFHDA